jgi:hypothetical protein
MEIRVTAIVEGETEEKFINQVVSPNFSSKGIYVTPRPVNHKYGDLNYDRVSKYIGNVLKEDKNAFVTTFFDLYALHPKFPSFLAAKTENDILKRVQYLENAFVDDIIGKTQCRRERFFPHIQPYEFEALLFSDISTLITLEPDWLKQQAPLNKILQERGSPELINGKPETKPSAWLLGLEPKYRKTFHGPLGASKISLDVIRKKCRHFDGWMNKLTNLKVSNTQTLEFDTL